MPWQTLSKWLFDGQKNSSIPDILIQPKSPITNYSLLIMFIKHGEMTHYINKYMNNLWMFSISTEDMLLFLKKCVFRYRLTKAHINYSKKNISDKLYDVLREKYPTLKPTDLNLLRDMINESPERLDVYHALGLEIPKIKKSKKKKIKKISKNMYLNKYFKVVDA